MGLILSHNIHLHPLNVLMKILFHWSTNIEQKYRSYVLAGIYVLYHIMKSTKTSLRFVKDFAAARHLG